MTVSSSQPQTAPSIQEGYNRWAAVYDTDANPLPALEDPIVRAAVGEVRGLAALDLGCGTGRHSQLLAEAGADVTAIDFSEGMLRLARQKLDSSRVRFEVHDLHKPLPFKPAIFDLVVCGLVLEHIRELKPFFVEISRVLGPAGQCVVSTLHPAMFLRGSQARFTDPATGGIVQPGSFAHQLGEIIMAAIESGFQILRVTEHTPDADLASRCPRAEKYIGWPMLVVLQLGNPS